MSITVEDGTGVTGANAYIGVEACAAYCSDRGLSFGTSPSVTGEQALIRATASIDAIYRNRFPGYKTHGRSQSLQWPRTSAFDAEWLAIASDEIPQEIIDATCEFAVRELAEAGSTIPDLERGGGVKLLRAGSVEIEYGSNSTAATVFQIVDGILASLLGMPTATMIGRAYRA